MARCFQASFDRIPASQLAPLGLWASVGSGVVNTTGRTGDGVTGTAGATDAQNSLTTKAIGLGGVTYQGFAIKCVSLPVTERQVWAILDATGVTLASLTIRPDGKVRVYRGSFAGGTLVGTSPTAFVAATVFRYLQVGYSVTSNTITVLSTTAAGVTSLLAAAAGLSSPADWSATTFTLNELLVIDDFYANTYTPYISPANNYFSGDTTIETLAAVAEVGTGFGLQRFYPNTGSDKAAVTDDAVLDYDATYVYCRDEFSYLLYQMETLTDDGRTVDDVQIIAVARSVSSDWLPFFGGYVRFWYGVQTFAGRIPMPSTGYRARSILFGRPGGNTWSIANVNNSHFGVAT